ncbi:MAG: anti-sigma factor family protein [Sulfuricaulis sp.]
MNCVEAQDHVHLYLDQELDLVRVAEVDRHLPSCAACRALYDRERALRSALRRDACYHRAPAELRERLRFALRGETNSAARPRTRWSGRWNSGIGIAAAVVLSVSVALFIAVPAPRDRLVDDILSSHIRSLMANHLSDVASSDQHTVKPWFDGKLDFSPPVTDLTTQGFPLIGGRLDYVNDHPVAALVYRHRLHIINLFIWPDVDKDKTKPRALERQGYNLLHWTQEGMELWAVSDLNETELIKFVHEISASMAPHPG